MSIVVDVDSHTTVPWAFRIEDSPLKRFAAHFPGEAGMVAYFTAGDMIHSLPVAERPMAEQLFLARTRPDGAATHIPAFFEDNLKNTDSADRLKWMDRIGIDYSIVNGPGFPAAYPLIDTIKTRQAFCQASNDELVAQLSGSGDRMGSVTYADLTDLDWAIAELTRMRRLGSRALSIRAEPVGGKSLGHPHFDRLWSAVTDLGMITSVHIGLAPALFGDWGRLGLNFDDSGGVSGFLRMANSQRYQAAELFLSALLFGGVFARHPKLTVLISELHVYWLPNFVKRMEALSHSNPVMGPWPYPATGGEYMRRQVRVTPLPGLGDADAMDVLEKLPEMIVFSSDFPHPEGNADPIGLYGEKLHALPADLRAQFMGMNIAESFARMGYPLVLAA